MKPEHIDPLEQEIDRALKALPALRAPESLVSRVMASIHQGVLVPWYRRAWTTWAMPWKITSLILLSVGFGAITFGAWWGIEALAASPMLAKGHSALEQVLALWGALVTVFGAFRSIVQQLPSGLLVGCAAAVVLGYTVCLALGTTWFRVLLARSNHHQ